MGDFNLPNVDWIHYSAPANRFYDKFLNFINESGLLQYVLEPTRHSNVLDLSLTNDSNLISGLQVECPFSDHNVIRFSVNVNHDHSLLLDNYSVNKFYCDFSSDDYDGMVSYLMNVDWFHEFTFVFSVEDYWQIFAHHHTLTR